MKRARRFGLAAVLVSSVGLVVQARAADAIAVRFEFKEAAIAQLFEPARQHTEEQISKVLADDLSATLRFWGFAPDPGYPQVRIWLKKTAADWQIVATLYADQNTPVKTWTTTWRTDADLMLAGGFGSPAQIVASVEAAFQEPFLAQQKDDMIDTLRRGIPLVRLDPQKAPLLKPSTAVLPLDWHQYEILKLSRFSIRYQAASGIATVSCNGLGVPSDYPAPPPGRGLSVKLDPEYDLAGQKMTTRTHLLDLQSMRPIGIYLERYDSLGAFVLDAAPDTPKLRAAVPSGGK